MDDKVQPKEVQPTYEAPKLTAWGSVVDVTQTGDSHSGGDLKSGSVLTPGQ